jgi:LPPG:FO 2-phospho-L-lactate transferase
MSPRPVVALAGGIGAARFLEGLVRVIPSRRVLIIGNTGDDTEQHGLHVSPDLDTVAYTLAGMSDPVRGWGIKNETFRCLESLRNFGSPAWFRLGDRDLATHLYRTERLAGGATLGEVTQEIAAALHVGAKIVPMTNDRVRTRIVTASGELEFQTYFVRRRARDEVRKVRFEGAARARPAPGIVRAIAEASVIIVCPSNPLISIGPILSVPGIRRALRARRERVIAITPIVGGRALKGPTAKMLKSMGMGSSAGSVANLYRDFAGVFVIDEVDRGDAKHVEALGMRAVVTNTVMSGLRERIELARTVIRSMGRKA